LSTIVAAAAAAARRISTSYHRHLIAIAARCCAARGTFITIARCAALRAVVVTASSLICERINAYDVGQNSNFYMQHETSPAVTLRQPTFRVRSVIH